MKTRQQMIDFIYDKVASKSYGKVHGFSLDRSEKYNKVLIGDLLDYIDKNLFRKPGEIYGMYEIDIEARNKCIITIYNIFIGNYRNPIEKLGDSEIEWIYNLISN